MIADPELGFVLERHRRRRLPAGVDDEMLSAPATEASDLAT